MNLPDVRQRSRCIDELAPQHFDLVIVGGGITGAGIMQLAARSGLKVLLLEAADFASGTSSRSSKLIHGGIRYLAMGDFAVVRETALERSVISALAPHMVVPRTLTMPVRSLFDFWKYRIGVTLYEMLGKVPASRRHTNLKGVALVAAIPELSPRYRYAVQYEEYLTDDARLVLANLAAGSDQGGVALNYIPVTKIEPAEQSGSRMLVQARCGLTGRELKVSTRGVINAAGPWVPQVCALANVDTDQPMVLSRGVHICIDVDTLAINAPLLLTAEDGRPVFVVPAGDVIYIGTTDVPCEHADRWPEVTEAETKYLLDVFNGHFGSSVTAEDCLHSWAGIRPLVSQGEKGSKEISRRDEIWRTSDGILTIAGGKLTGYRRMAEKVLAAADVHFGLTLDPPATEFLPGGDNDGLEPLCRSLSHSYPDVSHRVLQRLAQVYGSFASEVLSMGQETFGMMVSGEIRWAVEREGASQLEDVLYRRARVATYFPRSLPETLDPAVTLMATLMDWTDEECRRQKAAMAATEPELSG
ncbi:MAG: glycerol-3-phosphate dehydrogenase/oxidase [Pseudomonadota bacterium]